MINIVSSEPLGNGLHAVEIEDAEIAASITSGQLLMVRYLNADHFVPVPVADFDKEKGTITIAVTENGNPADSAEPSIVDVSGPVGRHPERLSNKVVFVAEDVGVAALYPRVREHKESGGYAIVIIGYPSKNAVFWQDRFDKLSDELYIVTTDGSLGIKGPCRHALKAVCENVSNIDRAVVIGPLDVMKACCSVTRGHEIRTTIGLGAAASAGDGAATAKFDWDKNSDLDGHQTDFDKLVEELGIQPVR